MEADKIRFTPSKVEGIPDVTEIIVYTDRIEFISTNKSKIIYYQDIAKPAESLLGRIICRLLGRKEYPMIGERDWFHNPKDRFYRLFSQPQITFYMPVDDTNDYGSCCFSKIQNMIMKGSYSTWDLG